MEKICIRSSKDFTFTLVVFVLIFVSVTCVVPMPEEWPGILSEVVLLSTANEMLPSCQILKLKLKLKLYIHSHSIY